MGMSKLKEKISNTDAAKIWAKNSEEDRIERAKNKGSKRVPIFIIRCIQVFVIMFTVYIIAIASATFVIPTVVSYLGGLARISHETDFLIAISTWIFPSLFACGLILVAIIAVIKAVFRMWNKCFGGIVNRLQASAVKAKSENESGTVRKEKRRKKH